MANKDCASILSDLWYDVSEQGYRALRKEHVQVIYEHGTPSDFAGLIVNGYVEPTKRGEKPFLTEKKANEIAKTYSRYNQYINLLNTGDALFQQEKKFLRVAEEYEYSAMRAISVLKDYLERINASEFLSQVISNYTEHEKRKIKPLIDGYNERLNTSFRIGSKLDGEYKLKMYNGKVIVPNVTKLLAEWKKLCADVDSKAAIYKTYLLTIKQVILDYDVTKVSPTEILVRVNNPFSSMDFNLPNEYTRKYLREMKGIEISEEALKLASFPDYTSVSILHDLQEDIIKEIQENIADLRL